MMRAAAAISKYIKFADPEVLRVLLENITTDDGIGLTTEDVEGVTSIGTWFKGNTEITSFDEFEKFTGVTTLSNSAFFDCTNLAELSLPKTLKVFGACALWNVPAAMVLDLPNLESFDRGLYEGGVFAGSGIVEVASLGYLELIPNGYNANTKGDFQDCLNLKRVNLPDTLTLIGNYAFYGCTNLEEINIPESVTRIGERAFYECTNLAINDPKINATHIGCMAFYNTRLSGVLSCHKLAELEALKTVYGQFQNTQLTKVADLGAIASIPAGYSSGRGVFHSCLQLITVLLPSTITSIGAYAFYSCSSLTSIISLATTAPTLGDRALASTPIASGTGYIYVPDASVADYQAATNWATYASQIKGYTEVDVLPSSATEGACYKVGDDFYVYQNNAFVKL